MRKKILKLPKHLFLLFFVTFWRSLIFLDTFWRIFMSWTRVKWQQSAAGFTKAALNASTATNLWTLRTTKMGKRTVYFAELVIESFLKKWPGKTLSTLSQLPVPMSLPVLIQSHLVQGAKELCLMQKKWPWGKNFMTLISTLRLSRHFLGARPAHAPMHT